MTTKIHVTIEALGNPTQFFLTPGQAHDLPGVDALLPAIRADTIIADKGNDVPSRVIQPFEQKGKLA